MKSWKIASCPREMAAEKEQLFERPRFTWTTNTTDTRPFSQPETHWKHGKKGQLIEESVSPFGHFGQAVTVRYRYRQNFYIFPPTTSTERRHFSNWPLPNAILSFFFFQKSIQVSTHAFPECVITIMTHAWILGTGSTKFFFLKNSEKKMERILQTANWSTVIFSLWKRFRFPP